MTYKEAALIMMDAVNGDYAEAKEKGIDACLIVDRLYEVLLTLNEAKGIISTNKHPSPVVVGQLHVLDNVISILNNKVINTE